MIDLQDPWIFPVHVTRGYLTTWRRWLLTKRLVRILQGAHTPSKQHMPVVIMYSTAYSTARLQNRVPIIFQFDPTSAPRNNLASQRPGWSSWRWFALREFPIVRGPAFESRFGPSHTPFFIQCWLTRWTEIFGIFLVGPLWVLQGSLASIWEGYPCWMIFFSLKVPGLTSWAIDQSMRSMDWTPVVLFWIWLINK